MSKYITLSDLYQHDLPDGALLINHIPVTCVEKAPSIDPFFFNTTKYKKHESIRPDTSFGASLEASCHQIIPILGESLKSPPTALQRHWEKVLQKKVVWASCEISPESKYLVHDPLENLAPEQHVIPPDLHYELSSKCFIPTIPCPQPEVLFEPEYPCVVKCAQSSSSQSVFIVKTAEEYNKIMAEIRQKEPDADILLTRMVEDIVGNYCCNLYLNKQGSLRWLGASDQRMDGQGCFIGASGDFRGAYQEDLKTMLLPSLDPVAIALHENGYFGIFVVDLLLDGSGGQFVIDINLRPGASSPPVFVAPMMRSRGRGCFLYRKMLTYRGCLTELVAAAEGFPDVTIWIMGFSAGKEYQSNIVNATIFGDSVTACEKAMETLFCD